MTDKLKNAIYVLLYDSIDTKDLELGDSDESYIETIINLLVEKNGLTCPYKNYGSEIHCPNTENCGKNRCDIDCGKRAREVWKDFIKPNN